jgi:hypothetical protein
MGASGLAKSIIYRHVLKRSMQRNLSVIVLTSLTTICQLALVAENALIEGRTARSMILG